MERLEFQRIAAGIAEKEGRLFALQAFKPYPGRNDERNFPFGKVGSKLSPFRHGQDCTEMAHRHGFAIYLVSRGHLIMFFVSGRIRA